MMEINSYNDVLCVPSCVYNVCSRYTLKINLNYTIVPQVMAVPEDRSTCCYSGCIVKTSHMLVSYSSVHTLGCCEQNARICCCTAYTSFIAYTIRAEKLKSLHLHIADFIYYVSMLNVWNFLFSLVARLVLLTGAFFCLDSMLFKYLVPMCEFVFVGL